MNIKKIFIEITLIFFVSGLLAQPVDKPNINLRDVRVILSVQENALLVESFAKIDENSLNAKDKLNLKGLREHTYYNKLRLSSLAVATSFEKISDKSKVKESSEIWSALGNDLLDGAILTMMFYQITETNTTDGRLKELVKVAIKKQADLLSLLADIKKK